MPLTGKQMGGRIPLPIIGTLPVGTGVGPQSLDKNLLPGNTGSAVGPGVPLSCLVKQVWVNPVGITAGDYISTGIAGPNNTTTTSNRVGNAAVWNGTYGGTGLPDFPRNAVVTVTHGSSIVAVNGVITGIDMYGRTITETWSVTATGTSKTYVTKTAFYRIDQITIIAVSDATADTVKLGLGSVLGLAYPVPLPAFVNEMVGTTVPTAGVIVAKSAAGNADTRGTYLPNTIPDAAHTYNLWYISDDPSLL